MPPRFDVAVLHDFFVDRLVHIESLPGALKTVGEKGKEGGGGVHGFHQDEVRGGNAVNLAHALARLGLRTLLITHSERTHEALLRHAFAGLKAELRVKPLPAGLTVAFEEKVNVMLGDSRGAADFGPGRLGPEDWEGLRSSRLVCSVNWAANVRGTELLSGLRKRLGPEKAIFLDPADFRERVHDFAELLRRLPEERLADWLSMNEYEGRAAAKALGVGGRDAGEVCRGLASRLGVVLDIHGLGASYSSEGTRLTRVPVRSIKPRRITGAGDVWDAASIYGRLRGMEETERLRFANGAARAYLGSPEVTPPTLSQVREATG